MDMENSVTIIKKLPEKHECIFCKRQTNNKYSYYIANRNDGAREKTTVSVCTKCLKKNSIIAPLILSALFLLTIVSAISDIVTGKQPMETGGLITLMILLLASLFWAVYNMYLIKTDKSLSETIIAKKLIRKAKRINPSKFYFTPSENELLTPDWQHTVESGLMAVDKENEWEKLLEISDSTPHNDVRVKAKLKLENIVIDKATDELVKLYDASPKGEGFLADSYAAHPVRKIGENLDAIGGFQLMLEVHKRFSHKRSLVSRNLEMVWHGIGNWQG